MNNTVFEIFKILIYILFSFFILYMGLPSLWYRVLSRFTIKYAPKGCVSITFDDGPDARYTPELLDKLKRINMNVTFFLLGSSAEKNKEIVRRQIEEGHEVALHGMNHKCHWSLSPRATFDDVRLSAETIRDLGGEAKLFRPPWGLYNIFTVLACKKYGLSCVHWSLHAFDWSAKTTTKDIVNTISDKVKSGDIILLHDGRGAEGAPQHTLDAVLQIAETIEKKNLTNVKIRVKGSSGK